MDKQKYVTVVVLNDGETFTDISGCVIMKIPVEQYEEITMHGGDARDFTPSEVTEIETIFKEV